MSLQAKTGKKPFVDLHRALTVVQRDGIDGPWSTFWVQVGTPPQVVRLLPGSSVDALWVTVPDGCTKADPSSCPQSRTVFIPNNSSTWHYIGIFHLGLSQETLLGYNETADNAECGNETFTFGLPGSGLPTVNDSVVEGFATKDFYMGLIGLAPRAINLTSLTESQPSLLQSLRNSGQIPSLSWAYTAGSVAAENPAFGSLTLGGYDTSRFISNNLSFAFVADSSRDLVLGLQSITTNASSNPDLLTTGISAFVDTLVPELWLPEDACDAFEQAFGLTWDNQTELYLLDDSTHNALVDLNPSVTFQLGQDISGGNSVKIVLPYTSFDLTATPPLVSNTSRYFPLKRAQNSTQYVLGRAFLQSAYVIADYERSNFSVSQALPPSTSVQQTLVAIYPPGSSDGQSNGPDQLGPSNQTNHSGLGGGAIAGIVIGIVAVILVAIGAIVYYRQARKKKRETERQQKNDEPFGFFKPELDGNPIEQPGQANAGQTLSRGHAGYYRPGELDNIGKAELSDGDGMASQVAELESDPASPYNDANSTQVAEVGSYYTTPPNEPSGDENPYFARVSAFDSHEMGSGNPIVPELPANIARSRNSEIQRARRTSPSETRSDLESLRDMQVSPDLARGSQATTDLEPLRARAVSPDIIASSERGSNPDDRGRRISPPLLSPDVPASYFPGPSPARGVSPYVPSPPDIGTDTLERPSHFRQDSGDGTVTPVTGTGT